MRKVVLSALLVAFAGATLNAQKLSDVQKKVSENKYQEAKESIDKILSDPKGQKDANAYYWKGVVYNELAKDSTKDNSAYRLEAYNAMKKYQEMDPKNVMGELEQNWRLFDIYNYYYNAAIQKHNAKDYKAALDNYRNAIDVQQYINQKNFSYNNQTLPALDTALTLYAGSAAFLAQDTAAGVQMFSKIADAKVGGKDYQDVYMMLVDYYNRKGDKANADKYSALGRQLYPDNDYWVYYELNDPAIRNDKEKLMAKYEELIAKNPDNKVLPLDYAIERFNYTYGQDKPADYVAAQAKLEEAIKKAISTENSAEANFLMMQHMSNQIYDLQEQQRAIKGTKPEDVKKKNALTAEINKKYDESVTYAEAAEKMYAAKQDLKAVEKVNYKAVLNQLSNYYKNKKQLDKAKTYDDKIKSLG